MKQLILFVAVILLSSFTNSRRPLPPSPLLLRLYQFFRRLVPWPSIRVIVQRFGNIDDRWKPALLLPTHLPQITETIDVDQAVVHRPIGGAARDIPMVRIDGAWKVSVAELLAAQAQAANLPVDRLVIVMQQQASAYPDLIREIHASTFATPDQAITWLQKRLAPDKP